MVDVNSITLLRYLGLVYVLLQTKKWRYIVLTEMFARVVKCEVRHTMRLMLPKSDGVHFLIFCSIVAESYNAVLSLHDERLRALLGAYEATTRVHALHSVFLKA